jgi:hypothetical protein
MILKRICQEIGVGGLDRFVMTQDTVKWLALLNRVMSKISELGEKLLASQKRLCSLQEVNKTVDQKNSVAIFQDCTRQN